MKLKTLIFMVLLALLAVCAKASDITRGATFSDGDVVTASQLHTLVDDATINPSFYTGKSVTTTPTTSVKFLIYDPASSSYKQITWQTMLNNAAVVTNQPTKGAPGSNDYVLILDISTGLPAKATVSSLVSNGLFGVFPTYTNATTPDTNVAYLALSNGVPVVTTRLDLFYQYASFATFTNVPAVTAPTNSDLVLLSQWTNDSKTNSYNRTQTRIGLFTNYPTPAVLSNTDTFTFVGSGGTTNPPTLQTTTFSNLLVFFSNSLPSVKFTTTNYTLATGLINTNHGLGATPSRVRWVLVCQTNNLGYVPGDEVDVPSSDNNQAPNFAFGGNATNIFINVESTTPLLIPKTNASSSVAAHTAITANSWRLKGYALP